MKKIRKKQMFCLIIPVVLALVFIESVPAEPAVTNDYSQEPLALFKDNNGNITSACISIPSSEYGNISQEFDIYFNEIGIFCHPINIGLKSRESMAEMKIMFVQPSQQGFGTVYGASAHFEFKDQAGTLLKITPDILFHEGRTYRVEMKYQEREFVRLSVNGKDEQGLFKLWDSGRLKTTGEADYDRVFFEVSPSIQNDIHYNILKGIYVQSSYSAYINSAYINNMVIKHGEVESDIDLALSTDNIAESDIILSKRIPCEGDRIGIKAKIHNYGHDEAKDVTVRFYNGDPSNGGIRIGKDIVIENIPGQEMVPVETEWIAAQNGLYHIFAVIDPDNILKEYDEENNKAFLEVPVTKTSVYFYNYSTMPGTMRWVTHRTCGKNEISYWKGRGVVALNHAQGWTRESTMKDIPIMVKSWSSAKKDGYDGFLVDEFGQSGELGDAMAAALLEVKREYPDLFAAVWCAGYGGKSQLQAYKRAADLVLPEAYCTSFVDYRRFGGYWGVAETNGFAEKTVMCLAFYGDKYNRQVWITTKQELLSQVIYLKRIAPGLRGLGFVFRAPDFLFKAADKAFYDYFIKPVIWVKEIDVNSAYALVANIGGIDAHNIKILFCSGTGAKEAKIIGEKIITSLKAGEKLRINLPEATKYISIVPGNDYTILGDEPEETANDQNVLRVDDYSNPPKLFIVTNKSEQIRFQDNISGAFYSIPSSESGEYGGITQEFDIHFEAIKYSSVGIGLKSRKNFGQLLINFKRNDDEVICPVKGARAVLRFQNADFIPVTVVPGCGFEEGKNYHVKMKYQKSEYVQMVIGVKDENGINSLWDSGKIKVIGDVGFDQVCFYVHPEKGSDIYYDKTNHSMFLRGRGYASHLEMIARVDNMVISYDGSADNER